MANLKDKKILLVDDSNTVLSIMKKNLGSLGVLKSSLATDGQSALQMIESSAQTESFDIILCDWIMPKLTGIELLKKIRSHQDPKVSNVRFIMITGASEKVKEAMQCGADNIISKPFTAEELQAKLNFVLR